MAASRDLSIQRQAYQVDRAFYERVRTARPQYKLADKHVIPPFHGRGFIVNKGQTFRVIQEEGPQVAEVAFWGAHDSKETYAAVRNRTWEGVYIRPYTRMWSEVPWLRPMMTCIDDTVATQGPEMGFSHHRFWTHCTPESLEMRSGIARLNACRSNFVQALEPFGLTEDNLRDNIVLFQKCLIDPKDGKLYAAGSDSKRGDYIEFYAEIDLLVAVSVCPRAGNTRDWSGPDDEVLPLGIELYETGIEPKEFTKWTDWRVNWEGKWVPPES